MGKIVGWSEVETGGASGSEEPIPGFDREGNCGADDMSTQEFADMASEDDGASAWFESGASSRDKDEAAVMADLESSGDDRGESQVDNLSAASASSDSIPVETVQIEAAQVEYLEASQQPSTLTVKAASREARLGSAISNLELYYHKESSYSHWHYYYDISEMDVHQIEFFVEAAEVEGPVDYFSLIQQAFAVKQRKKATKHGDWPDQLESPNLDELIAFLEERFRSSRSVSVPGPLED